MFATKYEIPVVLLSNNPNGLNENNMHLLTLHKNSDEQYIFISAAARKMNESSRYSIISKNKELYPFDIIFDINKLPQTTPDNILVKYKESDTKYYYNKGKFQIQGNGYLSLDKYFQENIF